LLRPSPSNNVKDYVELVAPNIFTKIFYFFTGLGHQAVIVFFVLSGFLVGGSVLRKGSQFSLLIYGLNRMTRLWTVLVPSLLFTAISDTLIARFSPDILSGDYLAIWNSGPNPEIYSNSVLTLLGNLFFLQTVSVPVFGINSPLWSLANEFWYYLIFPLLFIVASSSSGRNSRIVSSILVVVMLLVLPRLLVIYFSIWLLGVGAYVMSLPLARKSKELDCQFKIILITASILACFACIMYSKSSLALSSFAADMAIGLSFSILISLVSGLNAYQLQVVPHRIKSGIVGSIELLSDSSFTLYVWHFPLIFLGVAFSSIKVPMLQLSWATLGLFVLCLLVIYLVCHIPYSLIENNTQRVRGRLFRLLSL